MMPKGYDTNARVKEACYTLKKDINVDSITVYFKDRHPKRVPSINTIMNILKGAEYLIPDGLHEIIRYDGAKSKIKNYKLIAKVKYNEDGYIISGAGCPSDKQ